MGVGGSDNFCEPRIPLFGVVSFAVGLSFGLLVDTSGNDAGDGCLLFGVSCFCVDDVNVNDGRTCELLVGRLKVKGGGFPDDAFGKEKL